MADNTISIPTRKMHEYDQNGIRNFCCVGLPKIHQAKLLDGNHTRLPFGLLTGLSGL